ncbi:hypothetical protein [Marinoscillum furvescens]|uniref:Uncharacterized protein n=1 Tax=Marinoscillum furvescens DSM 4134 TaxID=1122208 RepID=A0A3D9L081_MARFU|nr:hypothetical protein [Marinoscillum furvescens]RED94109.1 hypothetical protein C7460_12250 [Marinoscillum furvescens DSM 4134]
MQPFDWRSFVPTDSDDLIKARLLLHHAIQNVAAVGRHFSPPTANDLHATLVWVPGLGRMAGRWVTGEIDFRSSISPEEFSVYLVDKKVQTLGALDLEGCTHSEVLIWLEEQIGKLGLDASNLAMNLPYELPDFPTQAGQPFHLDSKRGITELAKCYHNTYIMLRQMREELGAEGQEILIWPHHFDMALDVIIKDSGDPETTSKIGLGMSPGHEHFERPYFYVNSWPHTDTSLCKKLSGQALWYSDDWTGAILPLKSVYEDNQPDTLHTFYQEAAACLIELLTK